MCIARFSLSQLPQLASGFPLDDGLTKGPVNRAVSTTSPSATACQRSYPSGTRSPGDSFSPFLSPWALVMCRTTHMGTSSVLITLTKLCKTSRDPEICFLLLRFNRNEKKKQNFYIWVSLNLEAKEIFFTVAGDRLKRILFPPTRSLWRMWRRAEQQITFQEISPRTPHCLPDHCLGQSHM